MSDTANESGGNVKLGDSLTLTVPPDLVREFRTASGRGDVRAKMLEALEDWIDAREATRISKRIRAGTEKTIPIDQVKRELDL